MSIHSLGVLAILTASHAFGDVFSYEGDTLPDQGGWNVSQIVCKPELWVKDGWFFVHVELCDGFPPPGGQSASYTRSLEEFVGEDDFFIEWRMQTDGDRSELPWGGPSNFSASSTGPVDYRFSIAADRMDLNRDNLLPIVVVDFEAAAPHTHRLELYGDALYVWYVDGQNMDSGIPEGPYPSFIPSIVWRVKAAFLENTTKWDYIRYGTIPAGASGDFDSDGDHDLRDFYFFHECIAGVDRPAMRGGGVDPGCLWADLNQDNVVDLLDFADFQVAFTGSE